MAGCGGGSPLLHGAHALDAGKMTTGAGFSATFAGGSAAEAVREARRATVTPGAAQGQSDVARGDAAIAAFAPSVAPWVAARVGLSGNNEAGLAYTGRTVRLDVRHAFEDGPLALSIGLGASVPLARNEQDGAAPTSRFQLGFGSYGADVPILFGWQSAAGIVTMWVGPRAGYERLTGDALIAAGNATGNLSLHHWYAGAVVGLRLGFRHLHGAFELDTYYQSATGSMAGIDVKVTGVTLSPAAALIATF